jgi:hypothetical protein
VRQRTLDISALDDIWLNATPPGRVPHEVRNGKDGNGVV